VRQAPEMKSKRTYSVVKDEGLHLGRNSLEFLHNHVGAILSNTKVIESKNNGEALRLAGAEQAIVVIYLCKR
jgi:hypothetical protein